MRMAVNQDRKDSDYSDRQVLEGLSKCILHRWHRRCAFLDQCIQLVKINRFYEVMLETYLAAFTNIGFHPETGQSDSERRF
jgi:hypothetical protein